MTTLCLLMEELACLLELAGVETADENSDFCGGVIDTMCEQVWQDIVAHLGFRN